MCDNGDQEGNAVVDVADREAARGGDSGDIEAVVQQVVA